MQLGSGVAVAVAGSCSSSSTSSLGTSVCPKKKRKEKKREREKERKEGRKERKTTSLPEAMSISSLIYSREADAKERLCVTMMEKRMLGHWWP